MIFSKREAGPSIVSVFLAVLLFAGGGGGTRACFPRSLLRMRLVAFAFLGVFGSAAAFGVCDRLFFGCLRLVFFVLP